MLGNQGPQISPPSLTRKTETNRNSTLVKQKEIKENSKLRGR
jgi:hypothetical protein